MTRNGKIARLPADLRTELNQRLGNGEMIKPLAEWLNGPPKVQEVMQKSFEGRPINEDNISEWKNGGYRDWEASQRMGEQVVTFMDRTAALRSAAKSGLTDRMALLLAATMAAQMLELETMPNNAEKAKIWRELRIGLLALRKSELYAERLKMERVAHPAPKKIKPMTPEQKKERIRRILGLGPGYDGSKNPELTRPPHLRNQTNPELPGANRSNPGL